MITVLLLLGPVFWGDSTTPAGLLNSNSDHFVRFASVKTGALCHLPWEPRPKHMVWTCYLNNGTHLRLVKKKSSQMH